MRKKTGSVRVRVGGRMTGMEDEGEGVREQTGRECHKECDREGEREQHEGGV